MLRQRAFLKTHVKQYTKFHLLNHWKKCHNVLKKQLHISLDNFTGIEPTVMSFFQHSNMKHQAGTMLNKSAKHASYMINKKMFFQHINNRWKVTLYQLKIISCISLTFPSLLLLWKTNFKKQHYECMPINSSNFFIWIYELLENSIRTFLLICILCTVMLARSGVLIGWATPSAKCAEMFRS